MIVLAIRFIHPHGHCAPFIGLWVGGACHLRFAALTLCSSLSKGMWSAHTHVPLSSPVAVPLPSLFIPFAKLQSPHGVPCTVGSMVSRELNKLWTLSRVIKDVAPCIDTWMCVCTLTHTHTPVSSLRQEPYSVCCYSLTAYHRRIVLCSQSLSWVWVFLIP